MPCQQGAWGRRPYLVHRRFRLGRRLLQALDLQTRRHLGGRLLQHVLAIERRHAVVLGLLLEFITRAQQERTAELIRKFYRG